MKKFLSMLLVVAMVCTLFITPAFAAEDGIMLINDESESNPVETKDYAGHWSESSIDRWADAGLVKGDQNGNVNADKALTRAEFATLLVRLLGLKDDTTVTLPADTSSDAWYAEAMRACVAAGILTGDQNGNLNPNAPITRAEVIVMFGRALGVKPDAEPDFSQFADGDEVSDWSAGYLSAMADMGILSGIPGENDTLSINGEGNMDRGSVFAMMDKAVTVYITEPGDYEVNDENAIVIINVPAGSDGEVKISGTASSVVVSSGNTADVSAKIDADTVKIDSETDVTLERGSNVTDVDVNAPAAIENKGTVENLNTNVSGTTFDGKQPENINAAEGTDAPTDSKGNTVTEKPAGSTGGGSSSSKTYKYSISLVINGKGTAKLSKTAFDVAEEVSVTDIVAQGQTKTELPYVLESIVVTVPETQNGSATAPQTTNTSDITSNKKFTPSAEGNYTVTVTFVQPITKAALMIVDGADDLKTLQGYGYTNANEEYEATVVAEHPWLTLAVEFGEGYTKGESVTQTLTANGSTASDWASQHSTLGRWQMSYVGSAPEADNQGDALSITNSAVKFALTFEFKGASYAFACDYVAPGVDKDDLHTVTFKFQNGDQDIVYTGAKDEEITVPTAQDKDGWYNLNSWKKGDDVHTFTGGKYTFGSTNETYTAQYLEIKPQALTVRGNGVASGDEGFEYSKVYSDAGLSLTGSAGNYTMNLDAAKFIKYYADDTKVDSSAPATGPRNNLEKLIGDGTSAYFMGLRLTTPEGATTATTYASEANLKAGNSATDQLQVAAAGVYDDYYGFAKKDSKNGLGYSFDGLNDKTFDTVYVKWTDADLNIVAVTKYTVSRKTNNDTVTIKFVADGKDFDTQTKKIGEGYSAPATNSPTKEGYVFDGWYNGDTKLDTGAHYATTNVTYTAKFTEKTLTVRLNAYGGTIADESWVLESSNENARVSGGGEPRHYVKTFRWSEVGADDTLPIPTQDKEVFTGWREENDELKNTKIASLFGNDKEGDVVLNAGWAAGLELNVLYINSKENFDSFKETYNYEDNGQGTDATNWNLEQYPWIAVCIKVVGATGFKANGVTAIKITANGDDITESFYEEDSLTLLRYSAAFANKNPDTNKADENALGLSGNVKFVYTITYFGQECKAEQTVTIPTVATPDVDSGEAAE